MKLIPLFIIFILAWGFITILGVLTHEALVYDNVSSKKLGLSERYMEHLANANSLFRTGWVYFICNIACKYIDNNIFRWITMIILILFAIIPTLSSLHFFLFGRKVWLQRFSALLSESLPLFMALNILCYILDVSLYFTPKELLIIGVLLLSFFPVITLIRWFLSFFKRKYKQSRTIVTKMHLLFCPAAIITIVLVLCNSFIFLDCISTYRVQAYPECTLYPYVLVSEQNPCALYPCEIQKYYDEDNAKYHLNKIYFPNGTMNVSDQNIYLSPDGLHKYSVIGDNMKVFLINRKYTAAKNIASADIAWEVILLILAFLDMLYLLYCFLALIRNNMKLNAYDLYFKEACENIPDPVTHESITDTHSYINVLKSQKKN